MRPMSFLLLVPFTVAQDRTGTDRALQDALARSPAAVRPPETTAAAQALVDELARTPLADAAGVLRRILGEGAACAGPLSALLRDPVAAGGARAAAATLLGRLRRPEAAEDLLRSLAADEETAVASALALGDLRLPWTIPALVHSARSGAAPLPVRVAAAASALRSGSAACAPFLVAVLGANLPGRAAQDRQAGLPRSDRWAFERELAIAALSEAAGGETFGFDENASHAGLLAATARWEAWLPSLPARHGEEDPGLRTVVRRLEALATSEGATAAGARTLLQALRAAPRAATRPAQTRPAGG